MRAQVPLLEGYVNIHGAPVWIDHKALVLHIDPGAFSIAPKEAQAYRDLPIECSSMWTVWNRIDADILGTGRTELEAWKAAHLTLTEGEDCDCEPRRLYDLKRAPCRPD
jgi:hypothetical protein